MIDHLTHHPAGARAASVPCRMALLAAVSAMLASGPAPAQTYTWNGSGTGNDWNTTTPWLVNGQPPTTPPSPGSGVSFGPIPPGSSLTPTVSLATPGGDGRDGHVYR